VLLNQKNYQAVKFLKTFINYKITINGIFILFLDAKASPSKSKSSSANSSPKHPYLATSNSAMSAAEKRVQMMKKKANKKTDKKK